MKESFWAKERGSLTVWKEQEGTAEMTEIARTVGEDGMSRT